MTSSLKFVIIVDVTGLTIIEEKMTELIALDDRPRQVRVRTTAIFVGFLKRSLLATFSDVLCDRVTIVVDKTIVEGAPIMSETSPIEGIVGLCTLSSANEEVNEKHLQPWIARTQSLWYSYNTRSNSFDQLHHSY